MIRSFCLLPLLLASALAGCRQPAAPLTQARLSPERMESLVAGPMVLIRRGDAAAAEASVAALIAQAREHHGPRSVAEYDLLTAFGVRLLAANEKELARFYLRQAIDAGRRAFGPRHPESALALHTYADVIDPGEDSPPPAETVARMEEALAIRRETLGSSNVETLATLAALAKVKVRWAVATGENRAAAQAEALILEVMPAAEEEEEEDPQERHLPPPHMLRMELAKAYAASGRTDALMRMVEEDIRRQALPETVGWGSGVDIIWRQTSRLFDGDQSGSIRSSNCLMFIDILWAEVLDVLEKRGDRAAEQAIRARECRLASVVNDAA